MNGPTSFRLIRSKPGEFGQIGYLMAIYGGMAALFGGGDCWSAILGPPAFAVGVAVCLLTCAYCLRNRLSLPLQLTAGLIATAMGVWQAATGGDLIGIGSVSASLSQVAREVGVALTIAGLLGCVCAVHIHDRAARERPRRSAHNRKPTYPRPQLRRPSTAD
jgi:hypothetical protein